MLDFCDELQQEKSAYPRVLSEYSRTLGSTYCSHTNYETPSTKIGLFYTPTSSLYRISSGDKKIQYTDYLPFFQSNPERYYKQIAQKLLDYELKYKTKHADDGDQDVTALDVQIATSCKRYNEYIHQQMPHDFIPPLSDAVIAKILNKLEPDLTLITQDKVEEILEENLNVIQSENLIAIKQSIMDYILKNNAERARLNILIPPHHIAEWGYSPLPFSAPLSWGERLQSAWTSINESSCFLNRGIIEMAELWQHYKDYRLFGQPNALKNTEGFTSMQNIDAQSSEDNEQKEENKNHISDIRTKKYCMPLNIQQFRDQQEEHLETVRSIFVNTWHNDCVIIMKRFVEENQLDSSDESTMSLFRSIAAFMSRQLTEIVYESVKEMIAFFEQYTNEPVPALNENVLEIKPVPLSEARHLQPLWKIGLEVTRDGIEYQLPLDEISIAINGIMENIICCFDEISCVEGKIFGLLEDVQTLNVYIDHDFREESRSKIVSITSSFVEKLRDLQQLYSNQFAPLFHENDELTDKLLKIQHDETTDKEQLLGEFNAEIKKYEAIKSDVLNQGHLTLRMGLFEVECQSMHSLIINHCMDLKNMITNHVARKLIDKAGDLVNEYEDASKLLLKKATNAQDLVDLVDFMKLFDASQLAEWQNTSDDIGKELKFLFDVDHSLSHDLLRSVGRVSEWNKKIVQHEISAVVMCLTQRQAIEKEVIERSKALEQKLKKMNMEVDNLQILSEIRDHAKIDKLKEALVSVEEERVYLRNQQKLLGIDVSEFNVDRLKLSLHNHV